MVVPFGKSTAVKIDRTKVDANEVVYTKDMLNRLKRDERKTWRGTKRTAKGRRYRKINTMKSERIWDTGYREVDCLRDCHWLGACCEKLVLWVNRRPWPATEDPVEAQQMIDNYADGALPFELLAHGQTTYDNKHTGNHAWYLRCKMIRRDGLCGIYEQRPEVCRSFVPGKDPLCVKHPEHLAGCARFEAGMGQLIDITA